MSFWKDRRRLRSWSLLLVLVMAILVFPTTATAELSGGTGSEEDDMTCNGSAQHNWSSIPIEPFSENGNSQGVVGNWTMSVNCITSEFRSDGSEPYLGPQTNIAPTASLSTVTSNGGCYNMLNEVALKDFQDGNFETWKGVTFSILWAMGWGSIKFESYSEDFEPNAHASAGGTWAAGLNGFGDGDNPLTLIGGKNEIPNFGDTCFDQDVTGLGAGQINFTLDVST